MSAPAQIGALKAEIARLQMLLRNGPGTLTPSCHVDDDGEITVDFLNPDGLVVCGCDIKRSGTVVYSVVGGESGKVHRDLQHDRMLSGVIRPEDDRAQKARFLGTLMPGTWTVNETPRGPDEIEQWPGADGGRDG